MHTQPTVGPQVARQKQGHITHTDAQVYLWGC